MIQRLWKRVKALCSRVTGFSTPFGGLSWQPKQSVDQHTEERSLLSPADCAVILSISEKDVLTLLEDGQLVGVKIGENWSITQQHLSEFLATKFRDTQLEVLSNYLQNPENWAKELRDNPEQAQFMLEGEFEEGTLGKFLQDALREYPGPEDKSR